LKIVIFGLSLSSSWGNGHATLWRGLCRALIARGHCVVFFERDTPYYAAHRDLTELPGGALILYSTWGEVRGRVRAHLADADVSIVTSYCADALAATDEVLCSRTSRVFYDLDTPVTLARLRSGEAVGYIDERGLGDFDLVLSYTGGGALEALRRELGAQRVAPLYGSADPAQHRPVPATAHYHADLSYLGTFSEDRQASLESFFVDAARLSPQRQFRLGGAQYPEAFPWRPNIAFVQHLPPAEHSAFFCSARLTLNVTRGAMARMGYCPSGRLFEAAGCGVPMLSDSWEGMADFFQPGAEILIVRSTQDVLAAMDLPDEVLCRLATAARDRVMAQHTAAHRAAELEALMEKSCLLTMN
jgi:spore maturation protein CgeB